MKHEEDAGGGRVEFSQSARASPAEMRWKMSQEVAWQASASAWSATDMRPLCQRQNSIPASPLQLPTLNLILLPSRLHEYVMPPAAPTCSHFVHQINIFLPRPLMALHDGRAYVRLTLLRRPAGVESGCLSRQPSSSWLPPRQAYTCL